MNSYKSIKKMISGFFICMFGGFIAFSPELLDNLFLNVSGSSEFEYVMGQLEIALRVIGTGNTLFGCAMVIMGMVSLSDACSLGGVLGSSSSMYDITIPYYQESEKKGFRVTKGKYETITISMRSLSSELIDAIRNRVQEPLNRLYKISLKSKRAEKVYRAISPYLVSVAEDLESAIKECKNELMEETLINRLYVVEQFIGGLQEDIDKAVKQDKDETEALARLEAESYRPFTLTEELDKLV